MVATFSAQGQPIPRVRLPWSFHHGDLARLPGIQNIDGPVPAVLCSRRLGGADRTGIRGEDAQTVLDQFRWKDLYADGYAGQTSGNVTLRRAIAENLNGAAPGEFTSPYDFSGLGTLIMVVRRWGCGRGQWPRDNGRHYPDCIRRDRGRRREYRLSRARNNGGRQDEPVPPGCGSRGGAGAGR